MIGAFLAGVVIDARWFERSQLDTLRHHVLRVLIPVFFLSTGLRTNRDMGGAVVVIAAVALLAAAVGGKLAGVAQAGRILGWRQGEAVVIGWLLQTKALIMIIVANILLDKQAITAATFIALLLMALMSTMLAIPMVTPRLARLHHPNRGIPQLAHNATTIITSPGIMRRACAAAKDHPARRRGGVTHCVFQCHGSTRS